MSDGLALRRPAGAALRISTAVLVASALAALPEVVGDYFAQIGSEVMIFAIFAMSLDLLLGYTGLMSFGHAAFFGLGAYTLVLLGSNFDISPWIGLGCGVIVAAAGATVIGFFCVRVSGIPFLMLTLAFSQLLYSGAVKWRGFTGGSDGTSGPGRPSVFGLSLDDTRTMYYVVLVIFLLSFVALRRLIASPLGHSFVGIKENETRMRAMGYRTREYKLLAFIIGGAFAGLAGGLYAIFNDFISPDALHWSASGDILIMVVLGGAGTLIGPIIGSAAFLLLKYLISAESRHWILIIGMVFIACVLFFPRGIYGTASAWARRR
jgi:branched-chain amino acid transport system permease protein